MNHYRTCCGQHTQCINSRWTAKGTRRRYKCTVCSTRYTTLETNVTDAIADVYEVIRKKQYDRPKRRTKTATKPKPTISVPRDFRLDMIRGIASRL